MIPRVVCVCAYVCVCVCVCVRDDKSAKPSSFFPVVSAGGRVVVVVRLPSTHMHIHVHIHPHAYTVCHTHMHHPAINTAERQAHARARGSGQEAIQPCGGRDVFVRVGSRARVWGHHLLGRAGLPPPAKCVDTSFALGPNVSEFEVFHGPHFPRHILVSWGRRTHRLQLR